MAEYTFFTNPMSRGQIARWALHEVAADYDSVLVAWDNKPAALLAANPMGKVPVIVHHTAGHDYAISECAAICAYLAELHPAAGLLPTADERADYIRWMFFAAGPVEAAITAKSLGYEPPPEKQGMAGFGSVSRTLDMLEGHFKNHAFVCGDRFTMADVYVGSQVDWGLAFGTIPGTDTFLAYQARIKERPAYQAAKAIDMALIAEAQK